MQDSERRIQDLKVGVGRLLPAVVMGEGALEVGKVSKCKRKESRGNPKPKALEAMDPKPHGARYLIEPQRSP